jgi:hypothetical protein
MMKLRYLVVLLPLALAACPGGGSNVTLEPSPRETAEGLADRYAAVLVATENALKADLGEDVEAKIRTTSDATTSAFLAYYDEAGKCWRDQSTGQIVDAPSNQPGQHCDMSAVNVGLTVAQAAISKARGLLAQYGFPAKE